MISTPLKIIVPRKKKEFEDHFELLMDTFEQIGMAQIRRNYKKYANVHKQINGISSISPDNSDIVSLVRQKFGDTGRPEDFSKYIENKKFKNFDFLGGIVERIVQIFSELDDKVRIDAVDSESISEYITARTEEINTAIQNTLEAEVQLLCIKHGMAPFVEDNMTDEEKQETIARIQGIKEKYSIPNVDENLKKNFRNIMIEFAETTMEVDKERFNIDQKIRTLLSDFLISGSYFITPNLRKDTYDPTVWRHYDVFYVAPDGENDPQRSSIIGRQRRMTPFEILEEYGKFLTSSNQEAIANNVDIAASGLPKRHVQGIKDAFKNLNSRIAVGEEGAFKRARGFIEYDYDNQVDNLLSQINPIDLLQEEDVTLDMMGKEVSIFGRLLVTDVYYRTFVKYGTIKYRDEEGAIVFEKVSEEIYRDFLKDKNIKSPKNVSEHELINTDIENAIVWSLKEEVRWGLQIRLNVPEFGESVIRVGGNPVEVSLKKESDYHSLLMPVCGVMNKKSRIQLASDYQALHDYHMNEMMEMTQKEMGMLVVYDYARFAGMLNGAKGLEGLNEMLSIAKEFGTLESDSGGQPGQPPSNPSGQAPPIELINASAGQVIIERIKIADSFKYKALEALELLPMNQPINQEQDGVQIANVNTSPTLEYIYDEFTPGIRRFWETHVEVAKYAKIKNIDANEFYSQSINNKAFLGLENIIDLTNRKCKIFPINDAKSRRKLRKAHEMIFMNTINASFEERFELLNCDSMPSAMEKVRELSRKQQQLDAMNKEYEAKLQERKDQREVDLLELRHKHKMEEETLVGQIGLQKQALLSSGFQKDQKSREYLIKQAELEAELLGKGYDNLISQRESELKQLEDQKQSTLSDRQHSIKERELDIKEKKIQNELSVAAINKNRFDLKNAKKPK